MPRDQQRITDRGADRRYYFQMPNLADDDGLDVYEFRLLAHFRRLAGDRWCTESVRQTARRTRVSVGMVVAATDRLAKKGWLRVALDGRPGQQSKYIEILDRWPENMARYDPRSRGEQSADDRSPDEHPASEDRSPGEPPVQDMNTPVHGVNGPTMETVHPVNTSEERKEPGEEPSGKTLKNSARAARENQPHIDVCPFCGGKTPMLAQHWKRTCRAVRVEAARLGISVEQLLSEAVA